MKGMKRTFFGPGAGVLAAVWLMAAPRVGTAQDEEDVVPVIPAGVPVVVLPVQSAQPLPDGSWPGGAGSQTEVLETLAAELGFAFGEERGTRSWVSPAAVVDRARRNPALQVDPSQVAFRGLLRKPDERDQLYEPLHGQVRRVAALFGARLVVLPMAVWYRPPEPDSASGGAGRAVASPAERADTAAASDTPATEGAGKAKGSDPSPGAARGAAAPGRAVMLLALIDVRRSRVLWHGTIEGDPGEPGSPALLTTLALRVTGQLSPS